LFNQHVFESGAAVKFQFCQAVKYVPSPEKLANNQWKSKAAGKSKKGADIQSTTLTSAP
jgi:hypothetical protein